MLLCSKCIDINVLVCCCHLGLKNRSFMSALPTVAIFRILLVSKNCRFFKRDVSKLSIF